MKGKFSKHYYEGVLYGRRSRKEGLECEIVGENKEKTCYRVLWPGSKTPTSYHKSLIEILPNQLNPKDNG